MELNSHMLIGGIDNGDFDWLMKGEGKSTNWSCPKQCQIGDRVYIYVMQPCGEVVATARVLTAARPGHELGMKWRYGTKIGPITLLAAPIPLAELKELCPDWRWLNYPRAYAYIPVGDAKRIERRVSLKSPPAQNARIMVTGAGFGDPELNRRVEKAAVNAVAQHFRKLGAKVRSREQEKLGYDLDVTRGRTTFHVEVKGISSGGLAFPITEGEVRCAKSDSHFRLAAVTNVLLPQRRRIHLFTGRQFLRQFNCRPLAYMAKLS